MIYNTLSQYDFARLLSSNKDNGFTYEWALALFDYYDDLWEDFEFDAVAIRCDWNEMTKEELVKYYDYDIQDWETFDNDTDRLEYIIDCLKNNTQVIEFDWWYLILNF